MVLVDEIKTDRIVDICWDYLILAKARGLALTTEDDKKFARQLLVEHIRQQGKQENLTGFIPVWLIGIIIQIIVKIILDLWLKTNG